MYVGDVVVWCKGKLCCIDFGWGDVVIVFGWVDCGCVVEVGGWGWGGCFGIVGKG